MRNGLDIGFLLDRQWHWMSGSMDQSKKPTLMLVARVLLDAAVPYAVIGGVAMQVHQREPRTTLDIDLAVPSRERIPREALRGAGLRWLGSHEHSENWIAADGTPVQFTDDPLFGVGIGRALVLSIDDVPLRVLPPVDMLHAKLRAGSDPARRRSKRLQDLADAESLLEADPALAGDLTAAERALLDRLPE